MTVLTLAEFLVDASGEPSVWEFVPPKKKCSKCGSFKDLGQFTKQKAGRYGVRAECKCCRNKAPHIEIDYSLTKICTECNQEKNVSEFHEMKTGKYGVQSTCKCCKSKYMSERNGTEKQKAKQKIYDDTRYGTKEGREKHRASTAAWYATKEGRAKKNAYNIQTRRNGIPSPLAELPLQLYWNSYTSTVHEDCFKIGTGINAKHRNKTNQPKDEFRTYQNLLTVTYADRADGFAVESWFKNTFKQHQYDGYYFLKSGNTELFNIDLMEVYNIQLIHENIFFFIQDGEIKTPLKKDIEIIEKYLITY